MSFGYTTGVRNRVKFCLRHDVQVTEGRSGQDILVSTFGVCVCVWMVYVPSRSGSKLRRDGGGCSRTITVNDRDCGRVEPT